MKNPLIIIVILLAFTNNILISQSGINFGIGIGVNYSKLTLESTDVEIIDTYSGKIGVNLIKIKVGYEFNNKMNVSIKPEFAILSSKDNFKIKTNSVYANLPLIIGYKLMDKLELNAGVYYQYLLGLNLSKSGKTVNIIKLAKNRHFFNPSFGINYHINNKICLELNGIYSIRSLFNTGAEDLTGNIFGPLKAYNHTLIFTFWYNFTKVKMNRMTKPVS